MSRAILWPLPLLVGCCATALSASEPATKLEMFTNSPGFCEVTGLNRAGWVLGRREMAGPGTLTLTPFLRKDGRDESIPIPDDFTNVEVLGLSDSGHLVGFATRPLGHPQGNQRAVVWDANSASSVLLPLADGYRGSCAFDISQDGCHAVGFLLGRDPARLKPCRWDRADETWSCAELESPYEYNPLLSSAQVAISDDGRWLAASLVTELNAAGQRRYGLFTWQRQADESWQRRQRTDRAVHLGDINNQGLVVGRVLERGQRRAFVAAVDEPEQLLPLPEGRVSSYATDVNQHGQVVGVAEDPPGPEGVMSAFLWQSGRLQPLGLPADVEMSTANTITDEGRVGGLLQRASDDPESARIEAYVLQIE